MVNEEGKGAQPRLVGQMRLNIDVEARRCMSRGQVLANIPGFSESSSTLKNTLVSFGLDFFRRNKPTNSNQLRASGLKERDRV